MSVSREIFVNLPVRDLNTSMQFFSRLGFSFNKQFTDENAACMVVNDLAYVMLLTEAYFRNFTRREIADSSRTTGALFAVSCPSRQQVDEIVKKAIACGGKHAMDRQDHGFMYSWSFYDPDDHHWEVLWMDPKAVQTPELMQV